MKPADGRHLVDDQMIAVYIGAEPRFGRHNRPLEHLRGCPICAQRYEEVVQAFADARDEANAEADAIFTPERLEAQRMQILERLEYAGHPARVIPFPSHGTPNLSIFTGNQVRRWIAAAAAAGLIIGLTLGRMTDLVGIPHAGDRALRGAATVTEPARAPQPAILLPEAAVPDEEEILSRAEQSQSLSEEQVPPSLEALNAMTPTPIRDVALRLPRRTR